jgi:hypothetical protein
MTDPRTPSTEAGRRLMRSTETQDDGTWSGLDLTAFQRAIVDAEDQASVGSSERLAARCAFVFDNKMPCGATADHSVHHGAWHSDPYYPEPDHDFLAADPALSDPDAERQRAIGGLLRFTTHIRSCGWNSHKPCDCGLNQALGLTPTQDWRDDEALAADPALSDPDAERQRAIEQERARLRREYDDRMEMIGAASPPADVSPWDILRWVRDELLVDDPSAALPAAQETP